MSCLELRTLGTLSIRLGEVPVVGIESDKSRALLIYLAVESSRAHTRETLAGLLWPNVAEMSARASLSQALSNLRKLLEAENSESPFFLVNRNTIQFNAGSDVRLDVQVFESYVKLAQNASSNASSTDRDTAQQVALQKAAETYTGTFLEGFHLKDSDPFDEWVTMTRERLQRQALDVLSRLAEIHLRHQEGEAALTLAHRQLAIDGWREEAHQQAMRALVLLGRRSDALMQYERCRKVLASELGVEPSADTRTLLERIQHDDTDTPRATKTHESVLQQPVPPNTPTAVAPQPKLPVLLTSFIGRKSELERLGTLLLNPDCRLLTLVGAGGMGKTRLAIQAAYEQRDPFADGVVFVPLAPITTRAATLTALASGIGFTFAGPADPREQLLNELRHKHLLLVLDNFEQLLDESDLAQEVLMAAPHIKIIITSRQPLRVQGEWVFEVNGLTLDPAQPVNPIASNSAAIQLFLQSARRAQAGFTLTPDNQSAIQHICTMVGGMPLGIELAAAWVRVLSCDDIAQEIARSVDFLATTQRDVPERHRSMRAIIEQTWRMLDATEQLVLARLSVFRGGFTRDLATQVAGATLPILSSLVSKTLLRRTAESRYDLHELVRQYAAHALEQLGETDAVCERHAVAFLSVAQRNAKGAAGSADRESYASLEAEHNNLRSALEWCDHNRDSAAIAQIGLQLAISLGRFWFIQGHWVEGRLWLERMQSAPQAQVLHRERVQALMHLCVLWRAADLAQSLRIGEAGLALARESDDPTLVTLTLYELSQTAVMGWKLDLARRYAEETLERYRQAGDRYGVAIALGRLASIALPQKHHDEAVNLLHESIALLEELGDRASMAGGYVLLAQAIAARDQNWSEATHYAEKGRVIYESLHSKMGLQWAWVFLGRLAFHQEEFELARDRVRKALGICWELGALVNIRDALNLLAQIEQRLERPALGVRLFAAASQVARGLGIPFAEQTVQVGTQHARALMDDATFAAEWSQGETMPLEQAIQQALAEPSVETRNQPYGAGPLVMPVTAGGI